MRPILIVLLLVGCTSPKPTSAPSPKQPLSPGAQVQAAAGGEQKNANALDERNRKDRAIDVANKAVDAANQGKFVEALAFFKEALAIHPQDDKNWYMLGLLEGHLRHTDEAVTAFREALKLAPANSEYHYRLGAALWRAGEDSSKRALAQPSLEQAIALDFKNYKAHHLLGRVFKIQGQPERAAEAWTKSIELHPTNSRSFVFLGELYIQWLKIDHAVAVLNLARNHVTDPEELGRVLFDLGLALNTQAKWPEAIWAYNLSLAAQPGYPDTMCQRGFAFASAGDVKQAKKALEDFLKTESGDQHLRQAALTQLYRPDYRRKKPRRTVRVTPKALADANASAPLPPIPELKVAAMVGDAHVVGEMLVLGDKQLEKKIKVRGYIVWIYDCAKAIRTPGMSKKTLKRLLATEPERCTRPHFHLGETSKLDSSRVVEVVEVPRKLRPDELKIMPQELISAQLPVPTLTLGQEVIVSGRWATHSPKGFLNSEGLLVYESIEPAK